MSYLFNTYLYEPILGVLIFIYKNLAFSDLGIAIIILTILIRVILFPLFYKGAKDQTLMQRLQPHIKKIQLDHKDNKEKQAKAMLQLYREHRLNPFSGFLLLLLQLPILIALYQVFLRGLNSGLFDNKTFLGLINLESKSIGLAIFAAVLQYIQSKMSLPAQDKKDPNLEKARAMGKMMLVMGPVLTLVILISLPGVLGFYWAVSTLFSIVQQIYINKKIKI